MRVDASSPTNFGIAVTKKAIQSSEEMGKQALSLIQGATNAGNAPKKTSGVHVVA